MQPSIPTETCWTGWLTALSGKALRRLMLLILAFWLLFNTLPTYLSAWPIHYGLVFLSLCLYLIFLTIILAVCPVDCLTCMSVYWSCSLCVCLFFSTCWSSSLFYCPIRHFFESQSAGMSASLPTCLLSSYFAFLIFLSITVALSLCFCVPVSQRPLSFFLYFSVTFSFIFLLAYVWTYDSFDQMCLYSFYVKS